MLCRFEPQNSALTMYSVTTCKLLKITVEELSLLLQASGNQEVNAFKESDERGRKRIQVVEEHLQ